MERFTGILGMLTVLGLAYAFSANRQAIRYKTVAWGLGLQIAFAFLVMRWEYGRLFFEKLGAAANWLLDFAYYGTAFVFGDLGQKNSPRGFYFAFQALPTIIFIAALFAVLYYLGIMQLVVKAAARVMTRSCCTT
jgi:concentrative nucleoside transporter, CNT family